MNGLCIFARYPEKGKVKTRLAKDIGHESALKLYRIMLERLVSYHKEQEYELILGFTPKNKQKQFEKLFENVHLKAQKGDSLGEKMSEMFKSLLSVCDKVIIIGSDTPNLTPGIIKKAFKSLDKSDIVLGPAKDGGYYLIGMKEYHDVFSKVSWSSEEVLSQTKSKIQKKRLTFDLLEMKRDIDTKSDLKRYPSLLKILN